MTELETLLRRYAEGDITQEELQRLDVLSHRDEVLAGAASRARVLRRQRATRMSVVASLAIVVAVVVAVALRSGSLTAVPDTVMVAEAVPQPAVVIPAEEMEAPVAVQPTERRAARRTTVREVAEAVPVAERPVAEAVAAVQQEALASGQEADELPVQVHANPGYPVVACNSECSPDSVINDIWRFLRV